MQNGLALAGDYMSAASFLGIAGLVALSGFDGLIYSIGFLVGWPVVMCLIAEPLRNLGKYTFTDVVAFRLRQEPVRVAAAAGSLAVVAFYLIAQMVGAGNLIRLLFGLSYETAVVIVGAGDAGLRAVRRHDRDHVGADRQGGAAAARRIHARDDGAGAVFVQSARALRRSEPAVRRRGARARTPRLRSGRRDLARAGADVRHRGTAAHPDALLHRARCAHRTRLGRLRDGGDRRVLPADVHPRLRGDGARRPDGDSRRGRRRQHGGAAAGRGRGRAGVPRLHRCSRVRNHSRRRRRPHARRCGGALARHLRARVPPRQGEREGRTQGRARRDDPARGARRSCSASPSRGRTSPTWSGSPSRLPRARIFRR